MRATQRFAAGLAALALVPVVMAGSASANTQAERSGRPAPPIQRLQHIVVLMQENRSYDEYFGALHRMGQKASEAEPTAGNPSPVDPASKISGFTTSSPA